MATIEDHELEEEGASEDTKSQLVKAHSGLAAAINRVLSGEKPPSVASSELSSKPLNKRKRVRTKDVEQDEEGGPSLKHQSEVQKNYHWEISDYDINDEKKLHRLATRGVVQLFNAVSKHQKSIEDQIKQVGSSERKKHKILSTVDKGSFIDMLKSTASEPAQQPSWSVLRDDYLKTGKHENWNEDSNSENESLSDT